MLIKKQTHTIKILIRFLNGEIMISSDVFASNSNQFFCNIKNTGIELVEWKVLSEGRHLKRRLKMTAENIERAKKYLNKLLGVHSETEEGGH